MAQVIVTAQESGQANFGAAPAVGTLFIAGVTDRGPVTGSYALCESLTAYTNTFGPRSATSALVYDSVEHYFNNGGSQAYVSRVTDNTAASAAHVLQDTSSHPTVNVTALSPGTAGNGIFIVVTATGGNFTVELEDASGDLLETHGPYGTQAALLADTSSALVAFTQASGTGFTTANPVAITATAMTGGLDATDITDANHVAALANFPSSLGPGTVILPGKTTATCVTGLFLHALGNNRFAAADQADASTSAGAVSAAQALAIAGDATRAGVLIQGQLVKVRTDVAGSITKNVPGSAGVAALRAQAAANYPANPAPAGLNWPIDGLVGFTTAFANQTAGGVTWNQGDANALKQAGICYFATLFGTDCLDEWVTPDTTDLIYSQATAWAETMALVAECQEIGAKYEFATIDGQGVVLTALHGDLANLVQAHWAAHALFGDTANDAASINTGAPVNTASTAQAGELNAALAVKLSPYADLIQIVINVLALTQSVGTSS